MFSHFPWVVYNIPTEKFMRDFLFDRDAVHHSQRSLLLTLIRNSKQNYLFPKFVSKFPNLFLKQFPIVHAGLLGMPFLINRDAVVHVKAGEITTFRLLVRTRKLISLQAENSGQAKEYLPQIQTGPGIHSGKFLLFQEDDCLVYSA